METNKIQKQIAFRLDEENFSRFDDLAKNQKRTHASLACYLVALHLSQKHGVVEKKQGGQILSYDQQMEELH